MRISDWSSDVCSSDLPFNEGGAVGDLALRLGQRLALLGRHDGAEVILVRHHQVEPSAQDGRALLAGLGPPFRPGTVGGLDRPAGLGRTHVGYGADPLTGRRIVDAYRSTHTGAHPGTPAQALPPEHGWALPLGRGPPFRPGTVGGLDRPAGLGRTHVG